MTFVAAMARIGLIGFGGGSALIPVIEKEAVGAGKLIGREAYAKQVVVASITPGALPVELAGGIGWARYGFWGLVSGATAMALPGAVLTVLCVSLLGHSSEAFLRQIHYVSIGVVAFILMLLLSYVGRVLQSAARAGTLSKELFVVGAVFLLTGGRKAAALVGLDGLPLVGVSTMQIFAMVFFAVFFTRGRFTRANWCVIAPLCALYALAAGKNAWLGDGARYAVETAMLALAAYGFWRGSRQSAGGSAGRLALFAAGRMLAWLCLAALPLCFWLEGGASFAARGVLSSFLSFGGGDAYLTIADALFVEGGVLSGAAFYGQLVPIVNVLPGSILCKTLTGIGYLAGGAQGVAQAAGFAALGFLCSVGASCAVFVGALRAYEQLEELVFLRVLRRWTQPIIAGLLLTVGVSLLAADAHTAQAAGIGGGLVWLISLAAFALYGLLQYRYALNRGCVAALSAALSLGVCNLFVG